MSDAPERWVPWASLGVFVVGLYGGYTAGGWSGALSVWFGGAGLMMAAISADGIARSTTGTDRSGGQP